MAVRPVILATIVISLSWGLIAGKVQAQDEDQENRLPFEVDQQLPQRAILGLNSFGGPPRVVPGHHSDIPKPPLVGINPGDLVPPFHTIPRYYIYCYFYGCRPWFIHPYTGVTLQPHQVLSSVNFTNSDWQAAAGGRSLEELLKPDGELGEPMIVAEDMGIVDENNQAAIADGDAQLQAELENAAAANVSLSPQFGKIWHAPYYGLYCLRVRICVPIFNINNHILNNRILPWRFWCRFKFRRHQPICWRRTWWYRWWPVFGAQPVLRPWRPWCLPHILWTRSGPDWVCNIQNVNRYRHWCLWGFRYYFPRLTNSTGVLFDVNNVNRLPRIAALNPNLIPIKWWRPYPYPHVRYWPYRPYCTRWFWFRCFPWWWYRHFPPIIHFNVAVPTLAHGSGFVENPPQIPDNRGDGTPLFPQRPAEFVDGEVRQFDVDEVFDSFFDIDVECRGRPETYPPGDETGDGFRNIEDTEPLGVRQTAAIPENPDTEDKDRDDPAGN